MIKRKISKLITFYMCKEVDNSKIHEKNAQAPQKTETKDNISSKDIMKDNFDDETDEFMYYTTDSYSYYTFS